MEFQTYFKDPVEVFKAISEHLESISESQQKLIALVQSTMQDKEQPDEFLNVDGAARLLGVTKTAIYNKVSDKTIPFRRAGRLLRFSRQELTDYLGGRA
jgi:excisionase family DNA binding protein